MNSIWPLKTLPALILRSQYLVSPVQKVMLPIILQDHMCRKEYCKQISTNSYEIIKTITQEQVKCFSNLTDDSNPIHLEENYQPDQPSIVQGAFLMSLVAGVMGSHFPGSGSKVISQHMNFIHPCPVGITVKVKVEIVSKENNAITQRRKITEYKFSCSDVQDSNVCYMNGSAKLRIRS